MTFDGRHATMEEPDAIHPFAFIGSTDPSTDPDNLVGPGKAWLDTTGGTGTWVLKVRNLADSGWETVGSGGGASPATIEINGQTSSYTLVLSDAGKCIEIDDASASNLTVPTNASVAFPIGTTILVRMVNSGIVSIVAAGGVTVQVRSSLGLDLIDQWSTASLHKRDTNEWVLTGEVN